MLKVAFLPTNFGDSAKILTLPHPRNKKPNDFVISDGKLYEIQLFDRPHSSFFVNNSVISDGSALFAHQIHPLFMALPEMFENQKEFQMKNPQIFVYNSIDSEKFYLKIPNEIFLFYLQRTLNYLI